MSSMMACSVECTLFAESVLAIKVEVIVSEVFVYLCLDDFFENFGYCWEE